MAEGTSPSPVQSCQRLLRRWLHHVTDFLYPPGCASCGAIVAEAHGLCPACWRALSLIDRPYCERLGVPLPVDHDGPLLSPAAIADPPVFERARSVCRYDDMARKLVQRLKYGDRPELARLMGRMMATAGREILSECDLILPVPLHRFRLWKRRYNQAAVLAREISEHCGKPWEAQLLLRTRHTRTQTSLTRDQRRLNVSGVFAVSDEWRVRVKGLRLVLIDDVLTSGATANAAARVLLRKGATQVDILTFARVVKN